MSVPAPASAAPAAGPITLRLASIAQLYHTLDPAPFREGDLATEAEAYILDWARELPAKQPLAIEILLPAAALGDPAAAQLGSSIRSFFAGRARSEQTAIRELFRSGRTALLIGLCILAACLVLAIRLGSAMGDGATARVLEESLVIIGWVAIWRPAEIFLYEWLPHARRRGLFRRLAEARVEIRADAEAA